MKQRMVHNVVLLVFMLVGLASVHAFDGAAEAQCSQWSCGTCNTTTFYDCDSSGGPPFVYAYQLSGCDTGNQEMCGDNELACMSWCTSLEFEEQVDDCLTPQRRCHIGYPGSSACDEMAGTMDCTCGWFNMYCDW